MRDRIGMILGSAVLLSACGAPLPESGAESAGWALTSGRVADQAATASLVITFQSPRTSFSSEKIELGTGKTLPADDGMSPEGDLLFFYDGTQFQAIANASGGATRSLAPAKAGKATGAFAMAPIPLKVGSEILLKQDQAVYLLRITRLEAGSMAFRPDGLGAGTGSIDFSYQLRTPGAISRL